MLSSPAHQKPVVGFDLDMTLIDTRVGFMACSDALGAEIGVDFPQDFADKLGPPLDEMLGPYLPADQIPAAIERFRELYPQRAVPPTPAFTGAHQALAAVRRHGGRSHVITGKFTPNARLHIEHLGFDIDELRGEVWGIGKGAVLAELGCDLYVGDHVHDVAGAKSAGIPAVAVLTGGCSRDELEAVGAAVILNDLGEFASWFGGWLARR